jgi:hypothetical protein
MQNYLIKFENKIIKKNKKNIPYSTIYEIIIREAIISNNITIPKPLI